LNDIDELDFFTGIADKDNELSFSVDRNDEKDTFVSNDNDDNDNLGFETTDRLLNGADSGQLTSEYMSIFVSKIETSGLTSVERRADDANDVFLMLR
jgi:hypothetical protein